jgi:glutamate synthase (NADPH/NADH) small chain
MGKPTGFMEEGRHTPKRRPVAERVRDYREIYAEPDEKFIRAQAGRCMDCGVPFCNEGCPLGNIIPDFNDLLYRGKWEDALERLHRTNNFPEFTGRICPAPCESACVLGINDDPVTIEFIEKTLAEHGFAEGWVTPRPPHERTGRTVAIVGSGPAGMAAAAQLNRAGHRVTLYEKNEVIGGLLRLGIPDFKLEKWVIDRRMQQMAAEGVEFRTGVNVGRDVPAQELLARHDALLLTGGAEQPRDLAVPGRELSGVHFAMEFLTQQNRRISGHALGAADILAGGKNVVVLGGGDTGSDCIGTSHRQGARHVYNFELLEKPPASRPFEAPWPEHPGPAAMLRMSSSHEEGGSRDWAISTKGFSGSNGRLEKLHAVRLQFGEPDAAGRRPMSEVAGSEFTLDAELVLLALGFLGPVKDGMLAELGLKLSERGNVWTEPGRVYGQNFRTSIPRVYSAGDMRRGQSLVVWAIAEGRQAAAQIDRDLRGL